MSRSNQSPVPPQIMDELQPVLEEAGRHVTQTAVQVARYSSISCLAREERLHNALAEINRSHCGDKPILRRRIMTLACHVRQLSDEALSYLDKVWVDSQVENGLLVAA